MARSNFRPRETTSQAQGNNQPGPGKFNPKQFEAELEKYVIENAGITESEQAKFVAIYREKRQKEIAAMGEMRKSREGKPQTEKEWEEALKARDNMELKLKKIQQDYHNRMLKVIPASKVMKLIFAEEKFHREAFDKARQHAGKRPDGKQHHDGTQRHDGKKSHQQGKGAQRPQNRRNSN